MNRILIHLPHDRTQPGVLELVDDRGVPLFDCPCKGKADNAAAQAHSNPNRDPAHPYGDTPTGEYAPAKALPLGPNDAHFDRMGPWFIPLEGVSGDAMIAKAYGRTGLAIHSEERDEKPLDKLLPTNGCVRVLRPDMLALVTAMAGQPAEIAIDEGSV